MSGGKIFKISILYAGEILVAIVVEQFVRKKKEENLL